jgi:hypothetical protein
MRLAEPKAAEMVELSVLLGGSNFILSHTPVLQAHILLSASKTTIIGELYQVDGTSKLAYCRSKRVITESIECYGGICHESICGNTVEQNTLHFCSYDATFKGLHYIPAIPEDRFMCEEP